MLNELDVGASSFFFVYMRNIAANTPARLGLVSDTETRQLDMRHELVDMHAAAH